MLIYRSHNGKLYHDYVFVDIFTAWNVTTFIVESNLHARYMSFSSTLQFECWHFERQNTPAIQLCIFTRFTGNGDMPSHRLQNFCINITYFLCEQIVTISVKAKSINWYRQYGFAKMKLNLMNRKACQTVFKVGNIKLEISWIDTLDRWGNHIYWFQNVSTL